MDLNASVHGLELSERELFARAYWSTVPGYGYNALNLEGAMYKPIFDEQAIKENHPKPIWPNGNVFAACLTHDVDIVTPASIRQAARRQLLKGVDDVNPKKIARNAWVFTKNISSSALRKLSRHRLVGFEQWMEQESKVGGRSTFFFWPGVKVLKKRHEGDCLYELSDTVIFDNRKCTVSEMIKEIDRKGWEIGLHPSWHSYNDEDQLKRQKEALERVLGHDVVSVRQHNLHYDIRITPTIHGLCGFKFDSTLGFNDNIGFRFGTSYPWRLRNLTTMKDLSIIEIPLIIQELGLFRTTRGLGLDSVQAMEYVIEIIKRVKNVGGVLTLLWHSNVSQDSVEWETYIRILGILKRENAWISTVKDIGEWFSNVNLNKGRRYT